MIKKLTKYVGQYKTLSILTPIFILFEVGIEVSIPFVISILIDQGIENKDITFVVEMGLVMLALSLASLACGALAGRTVFVDDTGVVVAAVGGVGARGAEVGLRGERAVGTVGDEESVGFGGLAVAVEGFEAGGDAEAGVVGEHVVGIARGEDERSLPARIHPGDRGRHRLLQARQSDLRVIDAARKHWFEGRPVRAGEPSTICIRIAGVPPRTL